MPTVIAALYVERSGVYYGLPDVDPWDEARDARRYAGPWPVVAHPPCSRWCRLAALVQARWGHEKGDDGGTFEAALHAVRTYGGVLEHPAYSAAWAAFRLPRPATGGGWQRGICGGWTSHVEQGQYGHPARKPTWLYAVVQNPLVLPTLRWGVTKAPTATVSWGHHSTAFARIGDFPTNGTATGWRERRRLSPAEASASPPAFRDVLLEIARSAA